MWLSSVDKHKMTMDKLADTVIIKFVKHNLATTTFLIDVWRVSFTQFTCNSNGASLSLLDVMFKINNLYSYIHEKEVSAFFTLCDHHPEKLKLKHKNIYHV
jgi:hypothetical protein